MLTILWLTLAMSAGAAVGLLAGRPPRTGNRLEARIVDDADGEPLAARVSVTDPDGKALEVEGAHTHVQYLGRRWCYVDGSFSVRIPGSGAVVAIRRGFETRPVSEKVASAAAGTIARTFRLRRWIDMRGKGYVSGDIHAHLPALGEAPLQMRGEDLNVANLLTLGGVDVPANGHFTGRPVAGSTPGCELYVGQEIQEVRDGPPALAAGQPAIRQPGRPPERAAGCRAGSPPPRPPVAVALSRTDAALALLVRDLQPRREAAETARAAFAAPCATRRSVLDECW
jgi:hypothetical protein